MWICPETSPKVSPLNRAVIVPVVLAVAAGVILWRLNSRVPAPVTVTEKGMVLRNGPCRETVPVGSVKFEHRTADVLDIRRAVMTLFDGSRLVDEKIDLPPQYHIDTPIHNLLAELFHRKAFKSVADNGKAALFEADDGETPLRVLAIYKGKHDLEMLYPLKEGLVETLTRCLIEGKKKEGPDIVNNIVEKETIPIPEPDWNEKLFTLEYIVNKDM